MQPLFTVKPGTIVRTQDNKIGMVLKRENLAFHIEVALKNGKILRLNQEQSVTLLSGWGDNKERAGSVTFGTKVMTEDGFEGTLIDTDSEDHVVVLCGNNIFACVLELDEFVEVLED